MLRLASMFFAAVTVTACTSASDRLCQENFRCQGEEDPAAACEQAKSDDCNDSSGPVCTQTDPCKDQNEALSACILNAEPTCQDVGETSFYLPKDASSCETELKAFTDCAAQDD